MKINLPDKILSSFPPSKILLNEPMSGHTAVRTGGAASVLFMPETLSELILLVKELDKKRFVIVGSGSNTLVSDGGYNGIIIKTVNIKGVERYGRYVTALLGDTLKDISESALNNELTGMEWASGDTGTLGAAVSYNAAHFGMELRDILYVAEVITSAGELITLQNNHLNMRKQKSDVTQKGYTVLRAILSLERGDAHVMRKKMAGYKRFSETEPGLAATGEVFMAKNADAGRLIAEAGLAGHAVGGAAISRSNPNRIVNTGNAASDDVLKLIATVTDTVFKLKGARLKHNITLLGRF